MAGNLVHITTFGCQMNEYDSERLGGLLERDGYTLTEEQEEADIILFNTCSVRESAEHKLFSHVGDLKPLKDNNPDLIIGICGCMGQQHGKDLVKRVPMIDMVMGPRQIPQISSFIRELRDSGGPIIRTGFDDAYQHEDIVKRDNTIKAYVSIMEGCNHACTFCIVPLTRGKQVNRPAEEILKQVCKLAERGYKEITLLGQNVDAWQNKGMNFGGLLKAVNDVEGIDRIRYTSPHPSYITSTVIEAIAQSPKVCESFHLPLQSGSNKVLKDMKRVYTIEKFRELVHQIRDRWPDSGITTDLVVGFPGETEEEFQETLDAVLEFQFDNAYCFMFSPRARTPAADMQNQIPLDIRRKRVSQLVDLQNTVISAKMRTNIGKNYEILIEGLSTSKEGMLIGRTRNNLVAILPVKEDIQTGDLVNVFVEDASSYTLFCRPVSN